MDDILAGLPVSFPPAGSPYVTIQLAKELKALNKIQDEASFSENVLSENLEALLEQRIRLGNDQASFQLGQVQFENKDYESAWKNFTYAYKEFGDLRAKYQIAVMLYDALVSDDILQQHPSPKTEACDLLEEIVKLPCEPNSPAGQKRLVSYAAYNLGRAYHEGCGRKPSMEKALHYFKLAADDCGPNTCVLAQTALGWLYSSPDCFNLKEAFYWHSEACGNGSVESQAALGVMYLYGVGVKKDCCSALLCLSESARRGSLYGKANLAYFYYERKMFTYAAEVAKEVASTESDENESIDAICLNNFFNRAKAMGCFIYARCLHQGLGVTQDKAMAKTFYSKSVEYDSALASRYQSMVQHGAM